MLQAGAPPVTGPTAARASYRSALWANLVSLTVVAWYGVQYLGVALEARGRVAALTAVPPWYVYAGGLALAAALGAVEIVARLRCVPAQSKVYRLVPVLAVLFLGLHVFVVPPCLLLLPADAIIVAQLMSVERDGLLDREGKFIADSGPIAAALEPYPPPFVDRAGEPFKAWRLVMRSNCTGPVEEIPAGTDPGTLFGCISVDRTRIWLNAVGTGDAITGGPVFAKSGGRPAALSLAAPTEAERAAPDPDDAPVLAP